MTTAHGDDTWERLFAARALALALNPTLELDEIAERLLERAHPHDAALPRALLRLSARVLEQPSPTASRAAAALRRALVLCGPTTSGTVVRSVRDHLDFAPRVSPRTDRAAGDWPLGPA